MPEYDDDGYSPSDGIVMRLLYEDFFQDEYRTSGQTRKRMSVYCFVREHRYNDCWYLANYWHPGNFPLLTGMDEMMRYADAVTPERLASCKLKLETIELHVQIKKDFPYSNAEELYQSMLQWCQLHHRLEQLEYSIRSKRHAEETHQREIADEYREYQKLKEKFGDKSLEQFLSERAVQVYQEYAERESREYEETKKMLSLLKNKGKGEEYNA